MRCDRELALYKQENEEFDLKDKLYSHRINSTITTITIKEYWIMISNAPNLNHAPRTSCKMQIALFQESRASLKSFGYGTFARLMCTKVYRN